MIQPQNSVSVAKYLKNLFQGDFVAFVQSIQVLQSFKVYESAFLASYKIKTLFWKQKSETSLEVVIFFWPFSFLFVYNFDKLYLNPLIISTKPKMIYLIC